MFASARWQSLKLKRVRYIVPWDWNRHPDQVAAVATYMNAPRAARQQVLVQLHGCSWLLERQALLQESRLPRAERRRVPGVGSARSTASTRG